MNKPLHPQETGAHHILVVEDDESCAQVIETTLLDYQITTAKSGHEALTHIERHGLPHLAIVDLLMPGMNGFQFCEIVQSYSDLPVIMLTAVTQPASVIQGLQLYAEDYITKPFNPKELEARVNRILRRIGDFSYALRPVIEIDEHLQVDFPHQRIVLDEEERSLTPTESKLLHILMRNAGHSLHTAFIIDRLWPLQVIQKDTLRVQIYRLRRKIEPQPSTPRYILTERDVGYRFVRF
jgi:DNA-binding response OmpR family regulator